MDGNNGRNERLINPFFFSSSSFPFSNEIRIYIYIYITWIMDLEISGEMIFQDGLVTRLRNLG